MTTQELIDIRLEEDQGRLFEKMLHSFEDVADVNPVRGHLGASIVGSPCVRKIWYSFRWASRRIVGGRMLRLFNRGKREEAVFISLLRMIGCDVYYKDIEGKQFSFSTLGGFFGGSLDAVARGLPEMPDTPVLCEFKTHNASSFSGVKSKGVFSSKVEHYFQMQTYMHFFNLPAAMYMAANKNTDELYCEVVPYSRESALQHVDRAESVIRFTSGVPPRCNDDPSWFTCKMCEYSGICHHGDAMAENCRTCQYGYPDVGTGEWMCQFAFRNEPKTIEQQKIGCEKFEYI